MKSLTGSFLVAKPVLRDPNFEQSVVLMIQHDAEGAFGLVVNRPAPVEDAPFPVFLGGPCPSEGLLMIHGHEEWIYTEEEREKQAIAPGIFMGDSTAVDRATEAIDQEDLRYRLVVNYSGWGPDQLENEMVSKAWAIVPASGEVLFDTPVEELWQKLIPPATPNFSVN